MCCPYISQTRDQCRERNDGNKMSHQEFTHRSHLIQIQITRTSEAVPALLFSESDCFQSVNRYHTISAKPTPAIMKKTANRSQLKT